VTGNETARKMGVFQYFVKSPRTQLLVTNESEKTHSNRRCWHFCWHFCRHNLTLELCELAAPNQRVARFQAVLSNADTQRAAAFVLAVTHAGLLERIRAQVD
jgi:hypothetical protein